MIDKTSNIDTIVNLIDKHLTIWLSCVACEKNVYLTQQLN